MASIDTGFADSILTEADWTEAEAVGRVLLDLLAGVIRQPVDPAWADMAFQDLGVDSLALAEWAAEIELRYRIRIDDTLFGELDTIGAAAGHVIALRRAGSPQS